MAYITPDLSKYSTQQARLQALRDWQANTSIPTTTTTKNEMDPATYNQYMGVKPKRGLWNLLGTTNTEDWDARHQWAQGQGWTIDSTGKPYKTTTSTSISNPEIANLGNTDFNSMINQFGQQQVKRANKGMAPARNKAMTAYLQGAVY